MLYAPTECLCDLQMMVNISNVLKHGRECSDISSHFPPTSSAFPTRSNFSVCFVWWYFCCCVQSIPICNHNVNHFLSVFPFALFPIWRFILSGKFREHFETWVGMQWWLSSLPSYVVCVPCEFKILPLFCMMILVLLCVIHSDMLSFFRCVSLRIVSLFKLYPSNITDNWWISWGDNTRRQKAGNPGIGQLFLSTKLWRKYIKLLRSFSRPFCTYTFIFYFSVYQLESI